tara:strand:+ start:1559 stop:1708 length:150 start_codon:yes stop_codon:yes gene_type:complete
MEEELKEQIHAAIVKSGEALKEAFGESESNTVVLVPVVVVVTNCVIRKE